MSKKLTIVYTKQADRWLLLIKSMPEFPYEGYQLYKKNLCMNKPEESDF